MESFDKPAIFSTSGALQKYANLSGEKGKLECPLIRKLQITNDSYIFSFGLPDSDITLGLSIGQFIAIHAFLPTPFTPDGEHVKRKYTPTSQITQKGSFDMVIKIYRKGENTHYPEGGVMTQYLDTLNINDKILISGPGGKIEYKCHGRVYSKKLKKESIYKEIGFIAGGTGIAPIYQLMQAIYHDKTDETKVYLLFANKTEYDILLKDELEEFENDPRFKIYYTIDKAKTGWKGLEGYITTEMINNTMPAPSQDVLICCCGRSEMNKLVRRLLIEIGHEENNVLKF